MTPHFTNMSYLTIDTAKCTACGACIEACPNQVLKVVGIKFLINHRHIKVAKPKDCSGCLSCVAACPEGVIKGIEDTTACLNRHSV